MKIETQGFSPENWIAQSNCQESTHFLCSLSESILGNLIIICSHLPTPVSSKAHHQGLLQHLHWLVSLQPAPAQSQRSVPTSTLYYPRSSLHFFPPVPPPVLSEQATSLSNTSSLNHLKRKLPKHEINPACVNTQFSLNWLFKCTCVDAGTTAMYQLERLKGLLPPRGIWANIS